MSKRKKTSLSADPGCGKVDPDQEKRWEEHKRACLKRFKEMRKAEKEAKRIVKIQDIEGRRSAIALLEDRYGGTFAAMLKQFITAEWEGRTRATGQG